MYCYPPTIAGQHTRFLLTYHRVESVKGEDQWPIFERAFRDYGLLRAIRTESCPHLVARAPLRAIPPERVVDAPGHPAPAHPSDVTAGERVA